MNKKRNEIAARVRELRDCSNIEAEQMAQVTGLSVEDYLKMEAAEMDFPASSLYEICSALKADLTEILTGRPAHMNTFSVTRKGNGVIVNRRDQYGYENLAANFIHKKCEPFIVTVPVSDVSPELNSHFGQEFIYVLEGKMLVSIADNELTLESGDSIYIDSTKPHSMKAVGGEAARFLAVIL